MGTKKASDRSPHPIQKHAKIYDCGYKRAPGSRCFSPLYLIEVNRVRKLVLGIFFVVKVMLPYHFSQHLTQTKDIRKKRSKQMNRSVCCSIFWILRPTLSDSE